MAQNYFSGWGWILWFGFIFLLFSGMGNWGYTYQAHRRYRELSDNKDAMDLLTERFAKGEITRDEFGRMRDEIISAVALHSQTKATAVQNRLSRA